MESEKLIHGISLFFAFSCISFLHIVVGELAPKSLAIREAEKVGLWAAMPLYGFYWAMYPAIWVLNSSANAVLKLVRAVDADHGHDSHYSTDELKLILRGRRANVATNWARRTAPTARTSGTRSRIRSIFRA